jgi:hypothetical protein
MRPMRLLAVLAILWAGCGDGVVFISFNSGTVLPDPACRPRGGDFDMRTSGGLVVLVVIRSDTVIVLANGGRGTCDDIVTGASVDVRGVDEGERINASEVRIVGL